MKVKEFFWPEWRKFFVIIAIFVFYFVTYLGSWGSLGQIIWYILTPTIFHIDFLTEALKNILSPFPSFAGIVVLFTWILHWYILSCIIVFISDKIKGRKQK